MAINTPYSAGPSGIPGLAVSTPPDVRGPTAPFPRTIFLLGVASLLVLAIGTIGIQVDYGSVAPALSPDCISVGVDHDFIGAPGVCHIVEALRSDEQRVVLGMAALLGLMAIVLGFGFFR